MAFSHGDKDEIGKVLKNENCVINQSPYHYNRSRFPKFARIPQGCQNQGLR